MRISDWSSDVCSSDLQQREADLPFRPSVAHAGNDERHRPGQMLCRIEDDGPFVQRLFDEAELAELQIAKPAVQQRGGGRRRAAAQRAAVSRANGQPASGGVPGGGGAVDAAAGAGTSGVEGWSVWGRLCLGGCRIIKNK